MLNTPRRKADREVVNIEGYPAATKNESLALRAYKHHCGEQLGVENHPFQATTNLNYQSAFHPKLSVQNKFHSERYNPRKKSSTFLARKGQTMYLAQFLQIENITIRFPSKSARPNRQDNPRLMFIGYMRDNDSPVVVGIPCSESPSFAERP